MSIETFPVPGWPVYCVTKDGRVFGHKGELKQRLNTRGYPSVVLQDNYRNGGKIWYAKVSRVMALTFYGEPNGRLVRHLDDDKLNNHIDNLAYGTVADNTQDAMRNGRCPKGESHGRSKYSLSQIKKVKELKASGATYRQIAESTGVHKCTIWQVVNGHHWKGAE